MYSYNGDVTHTMTDENTPADARIAGVEVADAMSVLVRFDDTRRVGTTMDAAPAEDHRKNHLRYLLIRTLSKKTPARHARKIQAHFNGLRERRETIPMLQVEAAIRYLES